MIILDIETTGLDIKKCGIVSIGAVDFADPTRQFYIECHIRKSALVAPEALAVNGFTEAEIYDSSKISEIEAIERFLTWTVESEDQTMSGLHVASYDLPMITEVASSFGKAVNLGKRAVDLHSVCVAQLLKRGLALPLKDHVSAVNTDFIHPYCGLPKEPKPHNALTGAKYEAESLSRLIHEKGLFREFAIYDIPSYLKT